MMEWFEKEYKKRFDGETTLEGVDPDQLWKNVSASLPTQNTNGFGKRRGWIFLFALLLLIGVVGTWTVLHQTESSKSMSLADDPIETSSPSDLPNPSEDQTEGLLTQNTIDNKEESSIKKDQTGKQKEEQNASLISETKSNIETNLKPQTNTVILNTGDEQIDEDGTNFNGLESSVNTSFLDSKEVGNSKEIENTTNYSNERFETNDNDFGKEKVVESTKVQLSVSDELSTNTSVASNELNKKRDFILTQRLDRLGFIPLEFLRELKPSEVKPFTPSKSRINPLAIHINTSIEFFDLSYSDGANGELFASDANLSLGKLQIGNSGEFLLEYSFNDRWSLTSGLSYSAWENKLNTTLISDTLALDDLQVLRKAKAIRTVVHHNKLNSFSIPLQVNYNLLVSRDWTLGASLRAAYHGIISQRGRILSRENSIIDYTNDQNRQFNSFYSVGLRPYLRYEASDLFSVQLNLGISTQNLGTAEMQGLNQSALVYSGGLGIRFNL